MLLEKVLKIKGILPYGDRTIESIFIGNFENNVQEKFRKTNASWETVLTEYHCTKGQHYKFGHEEYLMKLRDSKYGLCLRGYGSKCHREVELMAFGTVPIVTPEVTVSSYMEPLVENTHYISVKDPKELKEKLASIDQEQWTKMSKSCYELYQKNVHSKNCWKNMIEYILYK
jgi:glycosyltransferase involved in cell wall biosynthesis